MGGLPDRKEIFYFGHDVKVRRFFEEDYIS